MHNKAFGSNKEGILEEVARVNCNMYKPCPICNKCQIKASHLYIQCQDCNVPLCIHTEKQRAMMIRRENFELKDPSPELVAAIRELRKPII